MHVRFLGISTVNDGSPTLYATDRNTYLVQGWKVEGRGRTHVEIPYPLLSFLEPGTCFSTRLEDTGREPSCSSEYRSTIRRYSRRSRSPTTSSASRCRWASSFGPTIPMSSAPVAPVSGIQRLSSVGVGDVQQARVTLGARLRELRKAANLTGRDLAGQAGWHPSKVTRLEQGSKMATEHEIRVWCELTDAPAQVPLLIASARNIDAEYQSWRRQTSRRLQQSTGKLEASAALIRGYDHEFVPGLLQTPAYARAILTMGIKFIGSAEHVEEALAERITRQRAVADGSAVTHFVLAEQALYTTVGDDEVMAQQLAALAELTENDGSATLGILPRRAKRPSRTVDFTIFDSSVVRIETTTASLSVTEPDELADYEGMFHELMDRSVVGAEARNLIDEATVS